VTARNGSYDNRENGQQRIKEVSLRNPEQPVSDFIERARELGSELDVAAEEIERRRELPEPIVEALVERGLFRLLLPRALGGAELPPAVYVQVIEEVAKHDASTA